MLCAYASTILHDPWQYHSQEIAGTRTWLRGMAPGGRVPYAELDEGIDKECAVEWPYGLFRMGPCSLRVYAARLCQ